MTFRLAIVCRQAHSLVMSQLTPESVAESLIQNTSDLQNTSELQMTALVEEVREEEEASVWTFVSVNPGLGKTELIRQHARMLVRVLVTVPITGPISMESLVERLVKANLKAGVHALHLDIGSVADKHLLNVFIFALLLLRTVRSDVATYHLPRDIPIYIEIANVIDDSLALTQDLCCAFQVGPPLGWDPRRIIVSLELSSPMQTCCNYLAALKNRTLNDTDLVLDGTDVNVAPLDTMTC